jgi:hypothetical protein
LGMGSRSFPNELAVKTSFAFGGASVAAWAASAPAKAEMAPINPTMVLSMVHLPSISNENAAMTLRFLVAGAITGVEVAGAVMFFRRGP